MDYIRIQRTGLQLSALCLGLADIGIKQTEGDAYRLLEFWLDSGGNCVDTARVYSDWIPGEKHRSERILGDWLRATGARHRLIIGTKAGHPPLSNMQTSRLSTSELQDDLQGSLETLRTDYIDVWWLHRDDERIPVGEIVDSCNTFVRAGYVKALGAANWRAKRLSEARQYASRKGQADFVATQFFWNLGSRGYRGLDPTMRAMDDEAEQLHEESALVAMPYSSQAGGFFTKWLEGDAAARAEAEASGYATERNFKAARAAAEIAKQNNVPVNAVVLAFLRAHPFPVIPIVGCTTQSQLAASIKALEFSLRRTDWNRLRELITPRGKRWLRPWNRHA